MKRDGEKQRSDSKSEHLRTEFPTERKDMWRNQLLDVDSN